MELKFETPTRLDPASANSLEVVDISRLLFLLSLAESEHERKWQEACDVHNLTIPGEAING